jgi:hypothetical protein
MKPKTLAVIGKVTLLLGMLLIFIGIIISVFNNSLGVTCAIIGSVVFFGTFAGVIIGSRRGIFPVSVSDKPTGKAKE